MTRSGPRRPATSRGGVQRPRKIAGQNARPGADDASPKDAAKDPAKTKSAPRLKSAKAKKPESRTKTKKPERSDKPARTGRAGVVAAARGSGMLTSAKTTRVLIVALGVLALVLATLAVVWAFDDDGDDKADDNAVSVPSDRPVVADGLAVQDGVDTAAKAAQEIVAIDYKKYDDEVDKAAELMTSGFEKEYRQTAAEIEKDFVAQKTVVQAPVVAQGVVSANRTRLQALVFLNQAVARERDGKPETVVTPYKVLVTMVHTDKGWLVDGLDTDAPQDKSN